ncbi:MAG: hypothetical protein U9R75_06680 [Candidatus Thermoplasmatota archaeon]|nr:hypothetical protein [Candidatus Thermoplasmatota archaeon]
MRLGTLGIVFLLISAPFFAFAAVTDEIDAKQGSPDGGGYRYTDGLDPDPKLEADYIDVRSDPNSEALDTSTYDALIKKDIGFNFKYYNTFHSSIYISTNGAMSFVETSSSSFSNYYNYNLPSTSSPRGLMAVYWTWDNCYTRNKDRLFILRTEIDGEKVFIVEWNTQQGAKYEALLYEGGMIKYQYFSSNSYQPGSYCTIGIEKQDGSTGVSYIKYQYSSTPKFDLPFAVAFTKDNMEVRSVSLTNGDDSGDMIYAGSKPYIFKVDVYHSSSRDSVLNCILILGSLFSQERIRLIYLHQNGTFQQLNGKSFVSLLSDASDVQNKNNNELSIFFHVDFRIEYPSEDDRNVSAKATGRSAIPSVVDAGEIYKVENDIEWDSDSLRVRKVSGESQYLKPGDFVAGSESIMFTGFQIFYEDSDIQPPPTIVSVNITDNFGSKKVAYIPQGSFLSTTWTVVGETAVMTFDFVVAGLNYKHLLNEPFSFTLMVDTGKPPEVNVDSIDIFQDEMDGSIEPYDESTDTSYDNDDNVFIKWDKTTDGESGIGGYFIEVRSKDLFMKKYIVSHDDGKDNISYHLGSDPREALPEGSYKVGIIAVDRVGNTGEAVIKNLVIDMSGPEFSLLDPVPGEWKMSRTPLIAIGVEDELSTVDGMTLFYRTSTNGGISYSEWTSLLYYGRTEKYVELDARPDLAEGKNNLLEIKGGDYAGSGVTFSEEFPIWVDQRAPEISVMEPAVDENRTTIEWLKQLDQPVKIAIHDWRGAGIDPSRMSYRISLNGGKSYSADIPLDGEPFNNSKGFSEYTFSIRKNWLEGSENLLVVDAYDLVGRNTTVVFRIRVDVTPVFEVISPGIGGEHYDNRSILFKVDVTDLDGEEDIDILWMSNLDGPIGFELTVEAVLSAGDHIITLTVEDGVHTEKRSIPLTVLSARLLDPDLRDSDSDGMNDSYEEDHGLDPFRNDADDDMDGDGFSNLEEYYAGTDPAIGSEYPGSDLTSSSISRSSLVVIVIGILLLVVFGILFVREADKYQVQPTYDQLPPSMYLQNQNLLQSTGASPQLPALPPARK